jgi:thiol-disulfide isomerase/thioredoxin
MTPFRFFLAGFAILLAMTAPSRAQDLSSLTHLLSTTAGEQKSVASIGEGKVTVVSFWATWCKPCKEEMRAMFPIVQKFQGAIEYIAISIDDTKTMAKVAPFVSSKGYTFTVLLDPNRDLFKSLNGTDVPYTLVYTAGGKLHSKHDGFLPGDEVKMEQTLISLVGSKKEVEDPATPSGINASPEGTAAPATGTESDAFGSGDAPTPSTEPPSQR